MSMHEALASQFVPTWQELENAIEQIPPDQWATGDIDFLIPARHILHALAASGGYLADGEPDWHRDSEFFGRKLDWEGTPASELPDQAAMETYLDHERIRASEWLDGKTDEQLLEPQIHCTWTGPNLLSRCIYVIRHTQGHVQEINAELRRRGLLRIKWEA